MTAFHHLWLHFIWYKNIENEDEGHSPISYGYPIKIFCLLTIYWYSRPGFLEKPRRKQALQPTSSTNLGVFRLPTIPTQIVAVYRSCFGLQSPPPAHRLPLGFVAQTLKMGLFLPCSSRQHRRVLILQGLFQSTSKRDLLKWVKRDLTIPTYLIRLLWGIII